MDYRKSSGIAVTGFRKGDGYGYRATARSLKRRSTTISVTFAKFNRTCLILAILTVFLSGEALAREKVKRHFLSYESLNRSEQYRKILKTRALAPRRFKVSRERVARVKRSSFWNKRPYQFATPLVDNGTVYAGSDSGFFYAIGVRKENKIWKFRTDGPVHGKAAISDGTIYFGDTKANVYALAVEDGSEKWRARLGAEVLSAPLVAGERLYVSDMSARLYAIDKSSGAEIWHTNPNDKGTGFSVRRSASPALAGDLILLGAPNGTVVAYRTGDGSVAWVRQLGGRQAQVSDVDSTPLVVGERVFVASADGGVFCLDARDGRVVWDADGGGPNDIIFHDGRLYASGGGVLSSVDSETGNIFWQQDLDTPEISSPVSKDHHIGVVSTKDKFYVIDTETGDVGFERYVGKGAFGDPVAEDDNIYLLSNVGRLYSFKIKELPPRKRLKERGQKTDDKKAGL